MVECIEAPSPPYEANESSIIYWKDYLFSTKLTSHLCKKKKNQLPVSVWFYFWPLYSVSLNICLSWYKYHSVLIIVAYVLKSTLDYFFKDHLAISGSLHFYMHFRSRLSISRRKKKACWDYDCVASIDQFGEKQHLHCWVVPTHACFSLLHWMNPWGVPSADLWASLCSFLLSTLPQALAALDSSRALSSTSLRLVPSLRCSQDFLSRQ